MELLPNITPPSRPGPDDLGRENDPLLFHTSLPSDTWRGTGAHNHEKDPKSDEPVQGTISQK